MARTTWLLILLYAFCGMPRLLLHVAFICPHFVYTFQNIPKRIRILLLHHFAFLSISYMYITCIFIIITDIICIFIISTDIICFFISKITHNKKPPASVTVTATKRTPTLAPASALTSAVCWGWPTRRCCCWCSAGSVCLVTFSRLVAFVGGSTREYSANQRLLRVRFYVLSRLSFSIRVLEQCKK